MKDNTEEENVEIGDATYSFGSPCPPIKTWFFPKDPNKKPYEIEKEEGEKKNDSSQSS